MFELPESKRFRTAMSKSTSCSCADFGIRVRREDLYDSASEDDVRVDEQDAAEAQARLKAHMSRLFSFDEDDFVTTSKVAESSSEKPPVEAGGESAEGDEEAYAFRLFSNSTSTPKVVLVDDEEDVSTGEGGMVGPGRPITYYLAPELGPEEKAMFAASALTADQVLEGARQRSWGLEVAWRVTKITVSMGKSQTPAANSQPVTGTAVEEDRRKKRRPGKKRRVALRTKAKERKEKESEAERQRASKEEHLKEKKKRLNRERKLKRRQKEKEKKAAGGGETQDGDAGPGSASDDSEQE